MSRTAAVVLAVLALAFAALTGLAVQRGVLGGAAQGVSIGGPFHLVDQTGKPVDERILRGKWSAVFFGFTYCPEACPTTLLALGQAETLLGAKAKAFQTVFVSVDPTRDTPKVMANYLSNTSFSRGVIGLTGTADQAAAAARAYHVFYQKAGEGPNYTVNHSTIIYLMNPKGRFVCPIDYAYTATPKMIADKIAAAMAAGPGATGC